jgi:hypothetical protein
MKRLGTIVVSVCCLLTAGGCEHCPPLAPGTSGVEVRVLAERKRGLHENLSGSSGDYQNLGPIGRFELIDYDNLPGVVVWLEPLDNTITAPPPAQETRVSFNRRGRIGPRTPEGVAIGSRLVFENQGDSPQSVYSLSDGNEFDLGTILPGQRGECIVRAPGLIEVLSESLSEPIARLYATPSPWLRTLRSNESACISGLPPGNYRVVCWHERLPGSQQVISLSGDKRSQVTLIVSVNLLPSAPGIQP